MESKKKKKKKILMNYLQNRNRIIGIENKLVVPKGEGEEEK